ncbi:C3orf58 (predicted) [Pycnogonum litorale]
MLLSNYVDIVGFRKLKLSNYFNAKNVYFGMLHSGEKVVLKKLSWNSEIEALGKQFCNMIGQDNCDPKDAVRIYSSTFMKTFRKQSDKSRSAFGFKDILSCPSERLINLMLNNFMEAELSFLDNDKVDAIAEFLTILHLNPEPLIVQTFKPENGWPFPRLYGLCGRIAVFEDCGSTLANFVSASWKTRVLLSYQLLRIADFLTNNPSNFSLYLTDVNLDNFAVSSKGHVILIDVENVIIVDKVRSNEEKPANWNKTLSNMNDGCVDCLSYSTDDICSHRESDHNYYAICRGILARNSYYVGDNGFLYGIPDEVQESTNLQSLIDQCAHPVAKSSRAKLVQELIALLLKLS